MSLLNTIKNAAKAFSEADRKLSDTIDSTFNILSKDESADIIALVHDLVYEHKQYKKAIRICSDHLYDTQPMVVAESYFYRAVSYYYSALDIKTSCEDYSEEELAKIDKDLDTFLNDQKDEKNRLFELAKKDIDAAIRICEDNSFKDWYFLSILNKAYLLKDSRKWVPRDYPEVRRLCIIAMQSSLPDTRGEAKELYSQVTQDMNNSFNQYLTIDKEIQDFRLFLKEEGSSENEVVDFIQEQRALVESCRFTTEYTFGERQFLFIVRSIENIAGCYDKDGVINWVFTFDSIPKEISFPVGHPQANTLYVAHPAQKGYYLPYEGAEEMIFHEKIEEFCRLAQCLGATEISFNSIKGESVSKDFTSKLNAGGNVGVKGNAVSGEYILNESGSSASELHKGVGYSYILQPKKAYVPTDVKWLDIDKSWQSFVKQRMEGNILSYTKRISSSEAINISNSLQNSAKASFENLMLNVNGNFSIESDFTFSRSTNSEWEIQIQFASLDELELIEKQGESDSQSIKQIEQQPSSSLSDDEEKYKEEVLFILEDGEITDVERRFLERKRIKLGLSKEQAAKVEAMCYPSLTDAEKEYIEIYKEIVGQDGVTDRKRRMLNREAESLGLTGERITELERSLGNV